MDDALSGDRSADIALPRHDAFDRVFVPGRTTLGLFFPIEAFKGLVPTLKDQASLAQKAEDLGFTALWARDVPLLDPSFGDVGQIHDPWVWLAAMATQTSRIALGTGAAVITLRHPLETAKAAASVDLLSGGRVLLGVASGDRPVEFPAYGRDHATRGADFREALGFLRRALGESFPDINSPLGRMQGVDLLPKPVRGRLPVLITGRSQQSLDWVAANTDAWLTYPRPPAAHLKAMQDWRAAADLAGVATPPVAQSLYIDLADDPGAQPTPIHLGYRLGRHALTDLLRGLAETGVGHVALNLRFATRDARDVVEEIGTHVIPGLGAVQAPAVAHP
ncbi:LLM class oxidoreductase [Roseivivax sediminis]|uniref:Luciferase-type oxidoreductase, BA3436 family n=1 Tax=Roseivivax sediminis TaxID=936889 RepID=A0A1I1T5G8_9RHOB|nr:LLM class oxidoreductase [Roseivivax sediminis]SFD50610.1 luciferase-type oxidoreductase, BA3436 family [Roseivivax sediminis]